MLRLYCNCLTQIVPYMQGPISGLLGEVQLAAMTTGLCLMKLEGEKHIEQFAEILQLIL